MLRIWGGEGGELSKFDGRRLESIHGRSTGGGGVKAASLKFR